MRILGVIPARGGSKGIPRKNLVRLLGKPLIEYTILAAHNALQLDRIVVSTEDNEIASISKAFGSEVLIRPADLAGDLTTTHEVLLHVIRILAEDDYYPDAVMTLQPTSPLRTAAHIDSAIEVFQSDPNCDSLVSCVRVPHIFTPSSLMKVDEAGYLNTLSNKDQPVRRQDKDSLFARNGAAIYITRTQKLANYIFGGKIVPYLMCPEESVDIDTYDDLSRAEMYLKAKLAP